MARVTKKRVMQTTLAEELSDPYALCKDKLHAWEGIPQPVGVSAPRYGEPRFWRCGRCGTLAIEGLNRNTGEIESRRYIYPPGYLEKADERIPKSLVRLEVLSRMEEYGTEWSLLAYMARGNGH